MGEERWRAPTTAEEQEGNFEWLAPRDHESERMPTLKNPERQYTNIASVTKWKAVHDDNYCPTYTPWLHLTLRVNHVANCVPIQETTQDI